MRRARKEEQFPENGFEQWGGYMNAKKSKLEEQFNSGASKESHLQATSKIFSGISVYVNGYTVPGADDIKMAMMLHGGEYHHYYSASKTKYIIASNLADAKLKKIKGQPKVVKPQWIADCLSAKKLLDFRSYLLYSNQSKSQPKIQFPQLSEFESPIKAPRYKKLQISFGESSIAQKLTSTPKVPRHKVTEVEEEEEKGSQKSLDLSGNLFDQSSTSAIAADEQKVLFESEDSTSSSNIFSQGEQRSEPEEKMEQVEEKEDSPFVQSAEVVQEDNSEMEDLLDCTLVAEELEAAEMAALQQNPPVPEVTLNEDPLSYSKETTVLVEEVQKSPPKGPMRRAGEPNFLAEFYSNSRLHHISTMGSTFKAYVSDLRRKHSGEFPARQRLLQWKRENGIESSGWSGDKIVMHIDMDCFFVSVGLRKYPELGGQPVAVTHAKGNPPSAGQGAGGSREAEFEIYRRRMEGKAGVDKTSEHFEEALDKRLKWRSDGEERSSMSEIASCNYEARAAGLRNGMFLGQALKLCPDLKTIPYNFEGYKEVSYALYNTLASFTLDIEAVSCDEMFVECTELLIDTNTRPLDFATFVRGRIKEMTGCPASTGFGANILQARMATKKAKPDGQFHLLPEAVEDFMKTIKVSDLPGVGRNLAYRMETLSLQTCADLQKLSLTKLQEQFGSKLGVSLYKHSRGEDERKLEFEHVRKSVSAEVNYGIRFRSFAECQKFVEELAEEVQRRLEAIGKQGRCITLKLMVKAKEAPQETAKFMGHGVCDSFSKSVNLAAQTSDAKVIARETMKLLSQLGINFSLFRGVGVQMTKLSDKQKLESTLSRFLQKGKQPPSAVPSTSKQVQPSVQVEAIDEAVLAELPEDIRNEILREYKLPVKQDAVAGPSRVPFAANLTLSQVDPDFLEALPDDLKLEVVADLKASKTRQGGNKILLPALRSPIKSKGSPVKRKRGRLKGSRNGTLKETPKLKRQVQVPIQAPQKFDPEKRKVPAPVVEPEEDNSMLKVNMKIEDLLQLVKDWVKSCAEPMEQDMELMLDFLQKLLSVGKLYQIAAVLRTLRLNVTRNGGAEWKAVFEQVVDGIQPQIALEYGCKLKF